MERVRPKIDHFIVVNILGVEDYAWMPPRAAANVLQISFYDIITPRRISYDDFKASPPHFVLHNNFVVTTTAVFFLIIVLCR